MEKLREVRLYGIAGARFGRVHRLAVSSTAEAVRALSVLIPGFQKFLLDARDNGLTFAVFNGRRNLSEGDLGAPVGGITQMLSPQQAGLAGAADNGTSYYFNGAVNSAAEGEPVPPVYGEMVVGSKVGSSGIYTEDQV